MMNRVGIAESSHNTIDTPSNIVDWLKPVISRLRNEISECEHICIRLNGSSFPLSNALQKEKKVIFSKARESTVSCESLNIPIISPHGICSQELPLPSEQRQRITRRSIDPEHLNCYRKMYGLMFHIKMTQMMNYWALHPDLHGQRMKSQIGDSALFTQCHHLKSMVSFLKKSKLMRYKLVATNFKFLHPELGIRVTIDALLQDPQTQQYIIVECHSMSNSMVKEFNASTKKKVGRIFESKGLLPSRIHQINLEALLKLYLFVDVFSARVDVERGVLFVTSLNEFKFNSKCLQEVGLDIRFRPICCYVNALEDLLIARRESICLVLQHRTQHTIDADKLEKWCNDFVFDNSFQYHQFEQVGPMLLDPDVDSSTSTGPPPRPSTGKRAKRKSSLRNSKRRKRLKLDGKIFHQCERFSVVVTPLTHRKSQVPNLIKLIREKQFSFNKIRYIARRLLTLHVRDCETISDSKILNLTFLRNVFAMVSSRDSRTLKRAAENGLQATYLDLCKEMKDDHSKAFVECRNMSDIMNYEAKQLRIDIKNMLDYGLEGPMINYVRCKYSCIWNNSDSTSQNSDVDLIPRLHAQYIVDRIRGIPSSKPTTLKRDAVDSVIREEKKIYDLHVASKKIICYRKFMLQTIDDLNETYGLRSSSHDSTTTKLSFKRFELMPMAKIKYACMTLDSRILMAIVNESLKPNKENDHTKKFFLWYNQLNAEEKQKWNHARHNRGQGLCISDFFPNALNHGRSSKSRKTMLIGPTIKTDGYKLCIVYNQNVVRHGVDGRGLPVWHKRLEKIEDIDFQPELLSFEDATKEQLTLKNTMLCDTGIHYLLYGCYEDSNGVKQHRYYSGGKYKHKSGINMLNKSTAKRQRKSKEYTDAEKELANYTTKTVNRDDLYRAVAKQILLYDTMSMVTNCPFLLKMRFYVESQKRKTMYDVLNHMTLNGTKTLIVGDGGKGSHAGTRGTCAGPLTKILRLAKRATGYNVHFFDESYTTVNSHCCHGSKVSKLVQYYTELDEFRTSPTGKKRKKRKLVKSSEAKNEGVLKSEVHGVVMCEKCRFRYNRDKHSSINLLNLFAAFIRGEKRDKFFTRNGQVLETQ